MTCPFGLRHRSGSKGTTGVSEEEQLLIPQQYGSLQMIRHYKAWGLLAT